MRIEQYTHWPSTTRARREANDLSGFCGSGFRQPQDTAALQVLDGLLKSSVGRTGFPGTS